MEVITECPATRSGKALTGTDTIDCLSIFATTKYKTIVELAPYVALAFAEVFGGFVGTVEKKSRRGFYYTTSEDVAHFIHFDGMDYNSWVDNSPEGVTINIKTKENPLECTCKCSIEAMGETFSSSFVGATPRDAELIAILVCCITFKRSKRDAYRKILGDITSKKSGKSFEDRMAGILPQNREKTRAGFFGRIVAGLKRT